MLYKNTTSEDLFEILNTLMGMPELAKFRLVGGTALSLLLGHRESIDIDMFTDTEYGTTDFREIETAIIAQFPFVENTDDRVPGLRQLQNNYGLHLFVGIREENLIKTDVLYWDTEYVFQMVEEEGIRLASLEEIAAMKMDAISRGGRKKDFWDLVELFDRFSLKEMLEIYEQKYQYNPVADVLKGLSDFSTAEEMPDPMCLRGRDWDTVKKGILAALADLQHNSSSDFALGHE